MRKLFINTGVYLVSIFPTVGKLFKYRLLWSNIWSVFSHIRTEHINSRVDSKYGKNGPEKTLHFDTFNECRFTN